MSSSERESIYFGIGERKYRSGSHPREGKAPTDREISIIRVSLMGVIANQIVKQFQNMNIFVIGKKGTRWMLSLYQIPCLFLHLHKVVTKGK